MFAAFLSAFIALFPVINPIGDALIVNGFLHSLDAETRRRAVRRIFFNCLLVGLGSLVAGHFILLLFGLAIPAIQVGGGLILCKTAWGWLHDREDDGEGLSRSETRRIDLDVLEQKLFYPLSFPVCVDPAAISVIVALTAGVHVRGNAAGSWLNYIAIAAAIVILLLMLYLLLDQGKRFTKYLGASGSTVINKLVAFLTFCIGIQIVLEGISKAFGLTIFL